MKIEIEKVRQKGKRRRKWKRRALERSKREVNEYGKRKKDEINRHPPPNSFVSTLRLARGAVVISCPFQLKQNKF